MTSLRQIEANRHNALKSRGAKTENGKQQSRRNALRHVFTAETIIEPLENPEDYRAFENAIVSEYLPQTPVEQELVHRLASLFWRLRRATSIETGLLRMQARFSTPSGALARTQPNHQPGRGLPEPWSEPAPKFARMLAAAQTASRSFPPQAGRPHVANASRDIAISFLRLANLDNDIVDRLGRYEAALWQQIAQKLRVVGSSERVGYKKTA